MILAGFRCLWQLHTSQSGVLELQLRGEVESIKLSGTVDTWYLGLANFNGLNGGALPDSSSFNRLASVHIGRR